MHRTLASVSALVLSACLTEAQIATEAVASLSRFRPDAVLLRFPDVSEDKIVFRYDNDLWTVPKGGGTAQRLTTAEGAETMPKFSPDGRSLAFMGSYEGGNDLYVLDVEGGLAERITHHPGTEVICDWSPGGGCTTRARCSRPVPRVPVSQRRPASQSALLSQSCEQ